MSARGKLMNDASEIETQQVSAIAMAIAKALLFVAWYLSPTDLLGNTGKSLQSGSR